MIIMKNIKRQLICFISIVMMLVMSSFLSVTHKYYVGLTEVNIDSKKHTLDVSTKLFMDDLAVLACEGTPANR